MCRLFAFLGDEMCKVNKLMALNLLRLRIVNNFLDKTGGLWYKKDWVLRVECKLWHSALFLFTEEVGFRAFSESAL